MKRAFIRAPLARVWRAISNAREFGTWFGVALAGDFAEGAHLRGPITHPGYEHLTAELLVERMTPPTYFAYRWHPYAIDPHADYSREPMTLVELQLAEAPGGTELTITESGFERIPEERRALALHMNGQGWATQLENVSRYVAGS